MTRPRRLHIALWLILLAASAALALFHYQILQIGAYQDDASYIILAQSLIKADRYGLMYGPWLLPDPPTFPFGFPLLLADLMRLGLSLNALKGVSFVATLVNISLLFWGWPLISRRASYGWGLAVAVLYGTSLLAVSHSRVIMSEAVFTTWTFAALLLTEGMARGGRVRGV